MNNLTEKFLSLIKKYNCPEERVDKLLRYCNLSTIIETPSYCNPISTIDSESLYPYLEFNIKLLSSLKIEDESKFIIFDELNRKHFKYDVQTISTHIRTEMSKDFEYMIKVANTDLFDEILRYIQKSIDETKEFIFGSRSLIKQLSISQPKNDEDRFVLLLLKVYIYNKKYPKILYKWTPLLEKVGCPENRIEKLALFSESCMKNEFNININRRTEDSFGLHNINVLSKISINDENSLIFDDTLENFDTIEISSCLDIKNDENYIDLLLNILTKEIEKIIEKENVFYLGKVLISSIKVVQENGFPPRYFICFVKYKKEKE